MANKRYKLITLDAEEIIKNGDKNNTFFVDLTSFVDRELKVLKEEYHFDNALFYQVSQAIVNKSQDEEMQLYQHVVYMDWDSYFREEPNNDYREKAKALLKNGVEIKFSEDYSDRFSIFDKSASMSRKKIVTFISKSIKEEVDKRLRLGMDFSKLSGNPNKYFSYRGLYMTVGKRIDLQELELDEEKVIIIPDKTRELKKQNYYTVESPKSNITQIDLEIVEKNDGKIKITPFDGEGFISPEYTEIINKILFPSEEKKSANSFQIRMPFAKGVLHNVDFKRFIKDEICSGKEEEREEEFKKVRIKDYFGKTRTLANVQIIMTVSMFKAYKWLKQWAENENISDPTEFYFDQMKKYDHALYISNSDAGFNDYGKITMNYQFFNTIPSNQETVKRIIDNHYEKAREFMQNDDKARKRLIRRFEDELFENDDEDVDKFEIQTWVYALAKNKGFINDPKIEEERKKIYRKMQKEGAIGRVQVAGCMRYLSGDLMFLMKHLISLISGINIERGIWKKITPLYTRSFYLPGKEKMLYKKSKRGATEFAILRNPHLSRNEICLLRAFVPAKTDLYCKYFGHLKGIVMVSFFSNAPLAMSGADFDGDLVKIIFDNEICKSIREECYKEVERENSTNQLHPKLKFANIPGLEVKDGDLGKDMEYDLLERTFSNRVGLISNKAISIEQLRQSSKDKDNYINGALCTIAVGLEIDSVKTGVLPDTSKIDKLVPENAEFLDKKYALEKEKRVIRSKGDDSGESTNYTAYVTTRNGERAITALNDVSKPGKNDPTIDMFPYSCLEEIAADTAQNITRNEYGALFEFEKCKLFEFKKCNGWKDTLCEGKKERLTKIIKTYKEISKKIIGAKKAKEKSKGSSNLSKIYTQLEIEYDFSIDENRRRIKWAIEQLYAELHSVDAKELVKDKNKMKEWAYKEDYASRVSFLEEELKIKLESEDAKRIICDTYNNAYKILIYALEDISKAQEGENIDVNLIDESSRETESEYEIDVELYNKWIKEEYNSKETEESWHERLGKWFREVVKKEFDNNPEEAIKYWFAISAQIDNNHSFFWNVFTIKDIKSVIAVDQEKENIDVR